jgi:UDP-3-O-[3-hydroxymyristoyl] glucosamine N-acyltransferase
MATLADAGPTDLSFLGSDAYLKQFAATKAAAVIVQKRGEAAARRGEAGVRGGRCGSGRRARTRAFRPAVPRPPVGRHHSASIAPSASVGDGARIGMNVFVGDAAAGRQERRPARRRIRRRRRHARRRRRAVHANVVLRERVTIGHRVIIHAGSVIGTDGFGYRWMARAIRRCRRSAR